VSHLLDVDVDVARAYLVAYPSALLRRAVRAVRGTVPGGRGDLASRWAHLGPRGKLEPWGCRNTTFRPTPP